MEKTNLSDAEVWWKLAGNYFNLWVNGKIDELYFFNETFSVLKVCSVIYDRLLLLKEIEPLENLSPETKTELKSEAKRIDPNHDKKKGMDICKTIHIFGYLSNK